MTISGLRAKQRGIDCTLKASAQETQVRLSKSPFDMSELKIFQIFFQKGRLHPLIKVPATPIHLELMVTRKTSRPTYRASIASLRQTTDL
jgi:hypothetical protein